MNYPTHEEYAAVFGDYEELEAEETAAPESEAEAAEAAEADRIAEVEEAAAPESEAETEEAAEAEETPAVQSAEERHRQAAARRERAQQEAEAATLARIEAAENQVYAELLAGQINPFTGKPITTKAEYRAYQQMKAQQNTTAAMEKAGLDPKMIQQLVQQELQPMKQQLQLSQMREAQAVAAEYSRRAEESISTAIKNIGAQYDPSVKTMEDIAAMPTAGKFNELVQKGVGMEDAFYLANREAIDKRRAAAAYRKGADAVGNRQHLAPTKTVKGKDPVKVPAGTAAMYREAMPGITEAEIAAQYAAYLNDLKE